MGPRRALGAFLCLVSVCSVFATFGSVTVNKNPTQPDSSIDVSWVWSGDAGATFQVRVTDTASSTTTPHVATGSPHTVTGLASSTSYTVVVVATLTDGSTVESGEESVTTDAVTSSTAISTTTTAATSPTTSSTTTSTTTAASLPPPIISNAVVGNNPKTEINVTWTGTVTSYDVSVKFHGTSGVLQTDSGVTSPHTVGGLTAGHKYDVTVKATSTGLTPAESLPVTVVMKPEEPTNIRYVNANNVAEDELQIQWDFTSPVDKFEVCHESPCTSPAIPIVPAGSSVTSLTISGLTAGKRYTITVKAIVAVGNNTQTASDNKELATKPSEPGALQFGVSETTINGTWVCSSGEKGKYEVTLNCTGEASRNDMNVPSSQCFKEFTGLTPGKSCSFKVQAVSLSIKSDIRDGNTGTKPSPVDVTTVVLTPDTNSVRAVWARPANGVFLTYTISILSQDGTVVASKISINKGTTTETISPLPVASTLEFRIVTVAEHHPSFETKKTFSTLPDVVAGVQFPTATIDTTKLTMEWTQPSDHTKLDDFTVWLTDDSSAEIVGSRDTSVANSMTTHEFEGLTPGKRYSGYIQAVFKGISGVAGTTSLQATNPDSPIIADPKYSSTTSDATVYWNPPASGEWTGFSVALGVTPKQLQKNDRHTSFSGLLPGQNYSVTVQTMSHSQLSAVLVFRAVTEPNAPTGLTSQSQLQDSLTFSWTAASGTVAGYEAQLSRQSNFVSSDTTAQVGLSGTTVTFASLDPGTQYYCRVRAESSGEFSGYSNVASAYTKPDGDVGLAVVALDRTSAEATWNKPATGKVTHYMIDISPPPMGFTAPVRINETSAQRTYTFPNLFPGRPYTVFLTPYSGSSAGSRSTQNVTTCPKEVTNQKAETKDTTTVELSWNIDTSNSDQDSVEIKNMDTDTSTTVKTISSAMVKEIGNLEAGKKYTFKITALSSGAMNCSGVNVLGHTKPESPSVVATAADLSKADIRITPAASSTQTDYRVDYRPVLPNAAQQWETLDGPLAGVTTPQLSSLTPGQRYEYKVVVISNGKESIPKTGFFQLKPKTPLGLQLKVSPPVTTTSLSVEWNYDAPGHVGSYNTRFEVRYTIVSNSALSYTQVIGSNIQTEAHINRNLKPGVEYMFTVVAETVEGGDTTTSDESAPLIVTMVPQLDGRCNLADTSNTDTNTIFANINDCLLSSNNGHTSKFKVEFVRSGQVVNTTEIQTTENTVTFTEDDGVLPGYVYELKIYAISGTRQSAPTSSSLVTQPAEPVYTVGPSSNQISVLLELVAGSVAQYEVEVCQRGTSTGCRSQSGYTKPNNTRLTFAGLTSYGWYTITVKYWSEAGNGISAKVNQKQKDVRTASSGSGEVQNVRIYQGSPQSMPSSVVIEWGNPLLQNGVMQNFSVQIKFSNGSNVPNFSPLYQNYTSTVIKYSVRVDLHPGEKYDIHINPFNNFGKGAAKTNTYSPDKSEPSLNIDQEKKKPAEASVGKTTSSFTVELDRSFVTNRNGDVVKYQVLVKSPGYSGVDDENAEDWQTAQPDKKSSVPYITGEPCNFFEETCPGVPKNSRLRRSTDPNKVLYRVGVTTAEDCKALSSGKTGKVFCNGPVAADREYVVKLRAFTSADSNNLLFSDSLYSAPVKTAKPDDGSGSNAGAIAGGVIGVIVALAVTGAVIFFVMRRRKQQPKPAQPVGLGHPDPIPMEKRSNPIRLKDFEAHYTNMSKDSDFLFASEYEELKPVGETQSKTAANLEENRAKNRFINILPYDHSRVKLQSLDDDNVQGSDYINASYMPGYNSKREFIVTQGPLPATCDDFWRMVWEHKCRAIVMLTRCMEKNKVKCHHYWPDNTDPVAYGDIEVAILNETKTQDWNITKMKMVNMKDNESRTITHFHYVAWPDFGVPENHQSLIRFVRTVRGRVTRDGGPIIIHCSAGVGRSGTFIVLDRTLQHIRENDTVDVFSSVAEMRLQRSLMVQTEAQYVLIHKCLLCVARGEENSDEIGGSTNPAFLDDEGITVEIS